MKVEIEFPPDLEALYTAEASAKAVSLERHIVDYLTIRLAKEMRGTGPQERKFSS